MEEDRLITFKDLKQILGISKTGIYRHVKQGSIPAPIYVGESPRWVLSEVNAWIRAQCAKRVSVKGA